VSVEQDDLCATCNHPYYMHGYEGSDGSFCREWIDPFETCACKSFKRRPLKGDL